MGIVYRSWHPALQRSVALKLLLAGPSASPVFNRRFRGEAPAAARLRHHGIITVFDLGDTDGQPYHTMELIEGSTLTDSLRSGLPSPPRRNASTSPPSPISGSPPHGPATHPSLTPRHEASPAPRHPSLARHPLRRPLRHPPNLRTARSSPPQSSWVIPWPAEPTTAITFSSTMETGGPILFAITSGP